jgi:hypothetical protein
MTTKMPWDCEFRIVKCPHGRPQEPALSDDHGALAEGVRPYLRKYTKSRWIVLTLTPSAVARSASLA